ncbi:MAG: GTPase Era [Marinilabiliales bacterium]|nr:MAG: GTPase Era [Marinilabiliales bacterium]
MGHKSGFVNILGNPNVGKSTIMNALVGENLSIITSKAQTTRHRIMGIVNGDDFQIVYSDTPGIIKPNYKLHESMMKFVSSAITDADILLYVTDVEEDMLRNGEYLAKISKLRIPVILLINKIDLSSHSRVEELMVKWEKVLPGAFIIPLSAKAKFNLDKVFGKIVELLPESPPYYPKDALTDKSERFFASEIIREKVFLNYQKEIPYSSEIEIEEFIREKDLLRIRAVIHVSRDTQKGIIIGKKGAALKKTGTEARIDLEEFFGSRVYLELFVKVTKDWRSKEQQLKRFGYR